MNTSQIIAAKRDGRELDRAQLEHLVGGFVAGDVPDYQMAAFAMAVCFRGMSASETTVLTECMLRSGEILQWPDAERPKVDKHSTGGIGDKTSIVLAPALACCGVDVPMISGRGLGATGGTLDKLDAITGFQSSLSIERIQRIVEQVGCVIAGANERIAPADQRLYALRDVTGTVPSIPLITSSILSKKLAEGLDALVMDVKAGSGSFMKTVDQARDLARSLVDVGAALGLKVRAIISDMNQPLGRMVGNAVEILECLEILDGQGPADLRELTVELGAELLTMCGRADSMDQACKSLERVLENGDAKKRFLQMVAAQSGDPAAPLNCHPPHDLVASHAGYVAGIDAEQLGWALIELGGGRKKLNDDIDYGAGLRFMARIGDRIEKDQVVAKIYCDPGKFSDAADLITHAIQIGTEPVNPPHLIIEKIT